MNAQPAPNEIYEPWGSGGWPPALQAAAVVAAVVASIGSWFYCQSAPLPFRCAVAALWPVYFVGVVSLPLAFRYARRTAWERGERVEATVIEKRVLRTGRHSMTIAFKHEDTQQRLRLAVGSQTYFRKRVGQTCVAYVCQVSVIGFPLGLVAVIDPSKNE
jgi:hypothetical protein